MEFKKFNELMQRHVASMVEGKNHLFEVDVDHDTVWGTYLDSFPE